MKSNNTASRPTRPATGRLAATYWLASVTLEGAAAWLGIGGDPHLGIIGWTTALLCHLLAAGLLLIMGFGNHTRAKIASRDRSRARLYGWLVVFLPVIGLMGSLVLQLVCDRWIRARGLVEDFQAETEHRVIEAERPETQMDLKSYLDEELAVQPVMDILAGFDDNLKRGAIDTLRRIGTPEAINILKKCLTDASPEVRYSAHTALTRLDETHLQAIKAAKEQLDTGRPTTGDHLTYARRCVDYGQSGLLDDDTRRHYLQMAREAFMAAQTAGQPDTDLALDLGRLEILLGAYDDAGAHFQSILDEDNGHIKALVGLAEVHYIRGNAEGLQTIARQMNAALTTDIGSVREGILLHFWASPYKAA